MNLPARDLATARPGRPPRPDSLRSLLRERTGAQHTALEGTALMRAFSDGSSERGFARRYLSRQYRLHRALERAIAPHLPDDVSDLRLRKAGWLADDLQELGLPADERPIEVPAISSRAAALGALYVLEGSTIGLQKVRRDLQGSGGWPLESRFVRGYGEASGAHWRSFLDLLESLPREQWPAAVAAAQDTFAAFIDAFKDDSR